ncbi:MAG: filamentous hemagglutinin N-terminal domain-containing protein [Oscillatoriaceae bacterium SKW80]|nr:filamentous hemagglutinin N-terminal domain-containing protein [Oscillatoriaceae bacterium SKYG93]MCX8121000.1 filamentous hemagglutinin N-terminal domain-containing protein [Oscillatoriaceae bacterium SKW80]MDW8452273.1 filamentous hemagglutinin N-terminal domain-containing protein [Oscillatoriaceae cyanobacterium SKYGB_i_bin93]HIK26608.1 filamentous hemagglutinin N-terminal domain-containing protein [Oscillatoriaceae cyanobacterium M7585_C2015_266]
MKSSIGRILYLTANLAVVYGSTSTLVRAQITADGTLPTQVNTADKINYTIEGGSRVGNNLFHSFREFSVPTGGKAFFNNAPDIQNIISRVTGGKISNINGILKTNDRANFFLLNPNGIIFGTNASLEIGGSFLASTANSLKFADGTEFSATNTSTKPLLTISIPVGLQFGTNPGTIVNRSQANPSTIPSASPLGLEVQSGKTFALVGGEIRLESGNITAPGGRIELGSVGANSIVNLSPTNEGFALNYEKVQNFQDIHLSGGANVDVTSFNPLVASGNIRVQGRRVTLTEGSQISSFTTSAISSGSIIVTASESVELLGTGTKGNFPVRTSLATTTIADGNAGDLIISTKRLIVREGAGLFTSSVNFPMQNPQGGAGNLRVIASELVEISGASPKLGTSTLSVETRTKGDAGTLEIITGQLILKNGAEVTAATSGFGRGGTMEIVATKGIELSGSGISTKGEVIPSTLRATSTGAGDAGNLLITTNFLNIRDRAEITASGTGTGGAGNLKIRASQLFLDNGSRIRAETAAGNQGSIKLNSRNIILRRNSSITTEAIETASGGNITVTTDTITTLENSKIVANAIQGVGGNIQITTQGFFLSADSSITASSKFGISGTVTINNPDVNLSPGLIDLPDNFTDPSKKIYVGCAVDDGNSFTVTRRGGLPEDVTTMSSQNVWRDWQDFSQGFENNILSLSPPYQDAAQPQPQMQEANAWMLDEKGNLKLVVSLATESIQGRWQQMLNCNKIERRKSDNSKLPKT